MCLCITNNSLPTDHVKFTWHATILLIPSVHIKTSAREHQQKTTTSLGLRKTVLINVKNKPVMMSVMYTGPLDHASVSSCSEHAFIFIV